MRTTLDKNAINRAVNAIEAAGIAKNGIVPKQFTGYIASFGAAVIQSGLIPAVVFFEDPDANSEEDRTALIKAIKHYLGINDDLSKHLLALDLTALFEKEEAIIEAAQAIKLALRTFKKSES